MNLRFYDGVIEIFSSNNDKDFRNKINKLYRKCDLEYKFCKFFISTQRIYSVSPSHNKKTYFIIRIIWLSSKMITHCKCKRYVFCLIKSKQTDLVISTNRYYLYQQQFLQSNRLFYQAKVVWLRILFIAAIGVFQIFMA